MWKITGFCYVLYCDPFFMFPFKWEWELSASVRYNISMQPFIALWDGLRRNWQLYRCYWVYGTSVSILESFLTSRKSKKFICLHFTVTILSLCFILVHSVQQKSISLIFRMCRPGSHVTYSCHHNSSRFAFPIFAHSWRFSVFYSLQSITPRIY